MLGATEIMKSHSDPDIDEDIDVQDSHQEVEKINSWSEAIEKESNLYQIIGDFIYVTKV